MKPNEVLDLSLDVVLAYVNGYSDRLFDQQIIAVQTGHWAGYFSRTRRPKSIKSIVSTMQRKRSQQEGKKTAAMDVDVDTFLARERKFQENLQK